MADFEWPVRQAPSLEKLVDLCRSLDSWLRADGKNVIVVHCNVRTYVGGGGVVGSSRGVVREWWGGGGE